MSVCYMLIYSCLFFILVYTQAYCSTHSSKDMFVCFILIYTCLSMFFLYQSIQFIHWFYTNLYTHIHTYINLHKFIYRFDTNLSKPIQHRNLTELIQFSFILSLSLHFPIRRNSPLNRSHR